jgi:LacI family transcriptional regulator
MADGAGQSPRAAARRPTATLATIARAAGVHISTVSRALSPSESVRSAVSTETVEAIRAIAAELDYRPNAAGAALRTGRTRMLGVLVPRLTDIVLASMYEGIEHAAAAAGYHTFVSNTQDDPRLQQERLAKTLGRGVEGVLLGDARLGSTLPAELRRQKIPAVLFNRRLSGMVSVTADDLLGGALAAEHLCSLGHVHIGVAGGQDYASTGRERSEGFIEGCRRHGVSVPAERVVYSGFDVRGGREAATRLLALRPRPTAIFAVNDFAAIGVMGAVRDAGLRVGDDVAIVGYNDVALAAELPVPLTSVRTPRFELGQAAVQLLLRMLQGERVRSRRMTPTLVVRRSSQR